MVSAAERAESGESVAAIATHTTLNRVITVRVIAMSRCFLERDMGGTVPLPENQRDI
jgi:hypothetical protein